MLRWGWVCLSFTVLVGCASTTTNQSVNQASLDLGAARTLTSTCSGCHAAGNDLLKSLTSYEASRLEALLLGFQQDPGGATAMHRMARGFSEEEIKLIAKALGK